MILADDCRRRQQDIRLCRFISPRKRHSNRVACEFYKILLDKYLMEALGLFFAKPRVSTALGRRVRVCGDLPYIAPNILLLKTPSGVYKQACIASWGHWTWKNRSRNVRGYYSSRTKRRKTCRLEKNPGFSLREGERYHHERMCKGKAIVRI